MQKNTKNNKITLIVAGVIIVCTMIASQVSADIFWPSFCVGDTSTPDPNQTHFYHCYDRHHCTSLFHDSGFCMRYQPN